MSELIYGIHTVGSLLKSHSERFLYIYILNHRLNKRLQSLLNQSKRYGIPVQYCDRRYLNNKVQCVTHQGIVAKIHRKSSFRDKDILELLKKFHTKKCLLLILDSITDPRNLGACLRCAGVFGVDIIIVSRRRSVGLSSVVWKVASGVADSIPFVRVTNLARTLQLLKEHDIWIVGTVLDDKGKKNIFQAKLFNQRLAVVMGSEESGIRCLTKRYCDELVSIPMMINSLISLNVSVATGIFLYEASRQRLYCKG